LPGLRVVATWHYPGGWVANANASHRGGFYQDRVQQGDHDIRPLTLINARVGWQGDHAGAFLIATNLFDRQQAASFFTDFDGRTRGVWGDRRVVGLSFEGRF
jgi:hypothetical protein